MKPGLSDGFFGNYTDDFICNKRLEMPLQWSIWIVWKRILVQDYHFTPITSLGGQAGPSVGHRRWESKLDYPAAAAAALLQSCPTLCNPIDGSPPGSPVPGILQARTLEWVAISFSKAWKWKVKVKSLSHVRLQETPWTAAYQAPPSMGFSRQEYRSGVPLPSPRLSYKTIIERSETRRILYGSLNLYYFLILFPQEQSFGFKQN